MSGRTVTPPHAVSDAYVGLLEAFRAAVEDAGMTVKLPSRAVSASFIASGSTTAVFARSLYLRNWPDRRMPRSQRLDLVVSALETFQTLTWSLTKSTVYLNYLVETSDVAVQLVQSLHFDFTANGQDCHPFFHVQLNDEVIAEQYIRDLRSESFDVELRPPKDRQISSVAMSIPTPDMTLASVLYCLVAHHLPGVFPAFAKRVHTIQNRLPLVGFDALRNSMMKSCHFKSSHWFAHMPSLA